MPKPMGRGDSGPASGRFDRQLWTFHNMPAVAPKLEPPGRHDAVYLPREIHVTGDVDIHEMAYSGDGELWFVNTRMSCLCTLASEHSVVPRWKPPFVSEYDVPTAAISAAPAMRDGRAAYVTARRNEYARWLAREQGRWRRAGARG